METIMETTGIPFGLTDWASQELEERRGEAGVARGRTLTFGPIRVKMVDYSPGYRADHWYFRGNVLLCLGGELETELRGGQTFVLKPGMSYRVSHGAESHRSRTTVGARLCILD